jgi:hypothetical protein
VNLATIVAISALSNWAVIEAWRHGEIFNKPRAWLDAQEPGKWWVYLLQCPYCLSHWTAAPMLALLLVYDDPFRPWWQWLSLPVLSFATTRLSNAFNDVLHDRCRTPKAPDMDEEMSELAEIAEGSNESTKAIR